MIEKIDGTVCGECDQCGTLFDCKGIEKAREKWKSEGWECHEQADHSRIVYCVDCAIPLQSLQAIQHELRNPRPRSTTWRRMELWKQLDRLLGFGANYARPKPQGIPGDLWRSYCRAFAPAHGVSAA